MNNKEFRERGTKKLASLQIKLISKNKLIQEIKYKMEGLDKAKNYNRYKALKECLTLVEDSEEL